MKGKLISISGLDGAGKTTQYELLRDSLQNIGYSCIKYNFDNSFYGEKADNILFDIQKHDFLFTRLCIDWTTAFPLMKEFVYNEKYHTKEIAKTVTAVFIGGCIQAYELGIKPLLHRGVNVICDRFWMDDIVYRGIWVEEELIRKLYEDIPKPDLAMYLKVTPEVIFERNIMREDGKSPLMSNLENINLVCRRFDKIALSEKMVIIDGLKGISEIQKEIIDNILRRIKL